MKKFYLIRKGLNTLKTFRNARDLSVEILGLDMSNVIIIVSVDGVDSIVPLQIVPNEITKFEKFLDAYKESRRW